MSEIDDNSDRAMLARTRERADSLAAAWIKMRDERDEARSERDAERAARSEAGAIGYSIGVEECDAAYERGLRRGMAIAREWDAGTTDVDWDKAEAQMEREIEEAKR